MPKQQRKTPALLALALCAGPAAWADPGAAETPPPSPTTPPATTPPPTTPPPTRVEGALGLIFSTSPDHAGGTRYKLNASPAIFLRYGRWTISNSGAFATRRHDDVMQGLGTDLHIGSTVRTQLGLRIDRGRSSSSSEALRGIDSVRSTIRLRLSSTWTPGPEHALHPWKLTLAGTTDMLGRGGGQTFDVGFGRDRRWSERVSWSYGMSLAGASRRYMQARFGVTPEESERSGYPVYRPDAGLLSVGASTGWRMEINREWAALWGASVSRLLGPAADSPLTTRPVGWELRGGFAWRF